MRRSKICYLLFLGFVLVGCEKDVASIYGVDADAPITAELTGSYIDYQSEKVSSESGIFSQNNHPEVIFNSDGSFDFELCRTLSDEHDRGVTLSFYIRGETSVFELDKVYSLIELGEARACVDLERCTGYEEMDSGTKIIYYETVCYKAVDGYIKFTKQEPYGSHNLMSGEFRFTARDEYGTELNVDKGRFSNCRVCFANEDGCMNL